MTTILNESSPTNQDLVGEGDDQMRELKVLIASLFKKGHVLANNVLGSDDDGQLKYCERKYAPSAVSGAISLSLASGTVQILGDSSGITGDVTITIGDPPDGAIEGSPVDVFGFTLIVKQNSVGGHGITFTETIDWSGGRALYQNTSANAETHYVLRTTDGGVTWYGSVIGDFNV